MSGRRPRRDELALWQAVARTTKTYYPERTSAGTATTASKTRDSARQAPPPRPIEIQPFTIGSAVTTSGSENDLLPGLTDRLTGAPLRMDRKAFDRLRRGKLKPESRIDLHGMTLDQARPALTAFLMGSHARNQRLVLVITGKGRHSDQDGPIPSRPGALRHNVPVWLTQPPLSQIVLQVTPAHARHGGGGALYIYLRRRRGHGEDAGG